MKNTIKRIWALLLAVVMVLSLAACAVTEGSVDDDIANESVDTGKTQLYVFNFGGGFGASWLSALKDRYEELHKDDVYEEGKKGIQIIVNNSKSSITELTSQIPYNRDEIYFTEYAYYYSLLQAGVLSDITEAVTSDLSVYGDPAGTTILDKLNDEQKDYYSVEGEDGQAHYYGIPHYAGYMGLMYNVDLFEQEKYYFADGVTDAEYLEDYFVVRSTDKRSAGPDGEYGTSDDGLPATYDEFFLLCDYIAERGQTPVNWAGSVYSLYTTWFMAGLLSNQEGKEQTMLNFTSNGEANTLGTISNGTFVADAGTTMLTADNGYEIYRQEGRYEALTFMEKLAKTDKYHNSLSFNGGYSHMNAQEDFLYAGNDGGNTAPMAMLMEGIWWESEASATFDAMTDSMGQSFSKNGRRFAMMPLPKANAEDAGQNVLYDHIYSMCFMKSTIEDWKKPIALDFIMFANTNASLVEFTQITNTPKALNYTMTEEELAKLSPFGRSVVELKQASEIVYPFSSEAIYVNQPGSYDPANIWKSTVNGMTYSAPVAAFHDKGISAEDYFAGLVNYYKDNWKQRIH